jgi:hypothetical protein
VTHYALNAKADPPELQLLKYNWTVPLEREGVSVTTTPDANEGTG